MSERDNNNIRQSAESLLRRELRSYCASESISEEGLRQIIERHKCTPNNNWNVRDYAFFRAACYNEDVDEGIIQCLLEYFPSGANATDQDGSSPLHLACSNTNVTLKIVQLLIDAAPDSVRRVDINGSMPLHCLCMNTELDGIAGLEILKLLIERHQDAVRHVDNDGFLPIHMAGGQGRRSPEFCRVFIEACPGSERMTDEDGVLPIHYACMYNTVATVQYLYKLHPDAINTTGDRKYPIHLAIRGVNHRDSPIAAVDIVKFLLDCDPNVKLQKYEGMVSVSLLHFACRWGYNDSTIEAALEMIKVIYDAYPEAIEGDAIASHIHEYHEQVQAFVNSQLVYARQAKDYRQMTTPDGNGQLPLHTALQSNVRLGSIKLLVKGNSLAVQYPDNSGALPLHVACQLHDSVNVIQYLVGLDATTLDAVDHEGNSALHLACHRARHEIIVTLLETYDAVSVSKRNAQKKLPIDLLFESSLVPDRESVDYTETVYRLLRAYPEMVMNSINMQKQQTNLALGSCPSQNGKKRKFGHDSSGMRAVCTHQCSATSK